MTKDYPAAHALLSAWEAEDATAATALADMTGQRDHYASQLNDAQQGLEIQAEKIAALEAENAALRPKPVTRFGMNVSPGTSFSPTKETASVAASRLKATYGALPVIKFFYAGALPTRFMPANEGQAPHAYVCFKPDQAALASGALDAAINGYLDTVPDGQRVNLVNWQEPDDEMWVDRKFTAEQFRAATTHLCDLVHAHAAGKDGRAEVWSCFMGFSLDVGRFDDNAVSRKLDGIGWDYYWNSQKAGTQDPAVALKAQADKTKALGIGAYSLLETGDRPDTFKDGATRATFWTQVQDAAASLGYRDACYFNAIGTTGDHRLIPGTAYSDPSIAAWSKRMTA